MAVKVKVKVTMTMTTTTKTTPTTTMMMFTSDLVSVSMFAWQFGHTVVTESGPKRILIENIVDTFMAMGENFTMKSTSVMLELLMEPAG